MSQAFSSHIAYARALAEVCAEIKEKRGIEFVAPSGISGFGGDHSLQALEDAAAARAFDWRAQIIVSSAPYVHLSVTFKQDGVDTYLWFRSPGMSDVNHVSFFTWALLALTEAELSDRKPEGYTPARYE